jgi:hypothetical protein
MAPGNTGAILKRRVDMPIITMILSGLALLAASVSLILTIREKKRNEERNAAFDRWKHTLTEYIDAEFAAVAKAAEEYANNAIDGKIDPVLDKVERIGDDLMNANSNFQDQLGQTLSNIMAFDPLEAQKKARLRSMGMGEDE